MSNHVFTGLNEKYWDHFGSSWIYTLREVAKYQGEIIVVDCGLHGLSKKKILEKGAKIITGSEANDIRIETIKQVSKYAKENKGKFVYWDADVFFEENIDKIFEEINEKILLTENGNPGFIAGPHYQWAFVEDIMNFMQTAKQPITSPAVFKCLIDHFEKFIRHISNTWNFTGLSQIESKKLEIEGEKPKVIHPTGSLKPLLEGKGFLFHDRKNDGYLKFIDGKTVTLRKLIKKSV
jgi:hypothetical protein